MKVIEIQARADSLPDTAPPNGEVAPGVAAGAPKPEDPIWAGVPKPPGAAGAPKPAPETAGVPKAAPGVPKAPAPRGDGVPKGAAGVEGLPNPARQNLSCIRSVHFGTHSVTTSNL